MTRIRWGEWMLATPVTREGDGTRPGTTARAVPGIGPLSGLLARAGVAFSLRGLARRCDAGYRVSA